MKGYIFVYYTQIILTSLLTVKNPVCIKFVEQTRQYETIKLNNKTITWVDSIKHLGNYFDTTMSDKMDCQIPKISAFIGSVNILQVLAFTRKCFIYSFQIVLLFIL